MKHLKLYPTLLLSFILSSFSVTSSALEETFTYGTQPSPWGIDPGLKQVPSIGRAGGSNGGGSYHPPEYKAAMEEQARKESEGKKTWCKANNYPAHVSFCAGFKAEETRNCQAAADAAKTQCQIDYNRAHTAELISCGKIFFSDNLLSQCNKAADSQLVADLLSCELSFKTTVSRC